MKKNSSHSHSDSEINSYTIIPNAYVIHLVTTLELNNQAIFYDFHEIEGVEYLLTIFPYKEKFCKYIICASPNKTQSDLNVRFFGVNYDGTLLQTYVIDNSEAAPISIVRSNVSLYWRGNQHSMNFSVPNVNTFSQVKESILNIFTFPSLTYVVQNEIVINFTLVKDYYFPSYFGIIVPKEKKVLSISTWDWCRGTLVGKLNQQMVYIWNTQNFAVINQFSELDDEEEVLISGGVKEYSLNTALKGGLISKGTLSDGLSYQANEIKGSSLDYVSLKTFVPLKNYNNEKTFLIAFTNTGTEEDSPYSTYVVIGYSSFKNTRRSIITENAPVTLVSEKDDTFDNYNRFYYKWNSEKKVLLVYTEGFHSFLREESGTVVLSDLIPYDLGSLGEYNPMTNNLEFIPDDSDIFGDYEDASKDMSEAMQEDENNKPSGLTYYNQNDVNKAKRRNKEEEAKRRKKREDSKGFSKTVGVGQASTITPERANEIAAEKCVIQ